MKKVLIPLICFSVFLMLIMPIFSFAQEKQGLVTCGKAAPDNVIVDGVTYKKGEVVPCGFKDAMDMINRIIRFILVDLAVPIAAIMFFYAGFLMVTSGGSTESRSKAKKILSSAVIGLLFVAGAWLIIRTLLSILGYDGAWIGF